MTTVTDARHELETLAAEVAAAPHDVTVHDVNHTLRTLVPRDVPLGQLWNFWWQLVDAVDDRDSVPVDSGDPEDDLARDAHQSYVDAAYQEVGLS